ncbi:MAG: lamin tail domain-containing protein [Nocardioidaceae bacterium]
MPYRSQAALGAALTALVAAGVALPSTSASAVSPDVVISEVYGGGGNSGADYKQDFVELYNRGTSPVDLSSWSVQYASATGTSYQVTNLTGSIAPGHYYLVGEGKGSGGTTDLPTPDASGTIALSGTAGKVALVANQTKLACGTACATAAGVHDFVGFGSSANDFEGTGPTAAPSNEKSVARNSSNADTDNNAADFATGSPTPNNTKGEGPTPPPPPVSGLQIHDVQGAAQTSPYVGKEVAAVPGVVTAVKSSGFWMQSAAPDDDPATSEGIFVFTNKTAAGVAPGDGVTVSGTVAEYRAGATGLATTELDRPTVTKTGTAPLPAPTLVGPGGRVPPGQVIEDDANGTVESQQSFDPDQDGIDFWESMEGMRVEIDDAQVVGPTSTYDELPVVPVGAGTRTPRGGIIATAGDYNPERVLLGNDLATIPQADVGDHLGGATVGVLDYSFNDFKLLPSVTPTVVSGGIQPEVTQDDHGSQLQVATFNVENLDPGDPQAKFDGLAQQIVHNLASPDIVGLEEVQDNNGATDDGTVAADVTLHTLIDAIAKAGGPTYQYREIDPVNDREGGEPGGNIRVAFLFQPGKSLSFVDRGTPSSTVGTDVYTDEHGAHLTVSPGRIDPGSAAWVDSRVPLAGEFRWRGKPLFVIGNHFASKGGDDPLFGRYQPPTRSSEVKRHLQAHEVRAFVDKLLAADPHARIVTLGDLNDFEYSETADILAGSGDTALTDLPRTLPANERYTYDYEGNSQVLDHILLSPELVRDGYRYDVVHVNAEFHDQTSDHDPQVVRLGQ